jgi:LPXTG-site transpeptidase (sortase) family protein
VLRSLIALGIAAGIALAAESCAPQYGSAGPATPSQAVAAPAPSGTGPVPSTVPPIPDGYRINIPRLSIDLPIAEGEITRDIDQQRTPEGFAFHLPGTAIPGERGNAYIYSHARAGMFLSLWGAQIGDDVFVSTPDGGRLTYVVSDVRPKVASNDVSVAQPTTDERLTLQTSTGPSPGDPRFVVIALIRR